ncbi:MAG TPA: hypothetical protein VGC97_12915 [Pyrinomonadaceae bacterium]
MLKIYGMLWAIIAALAVLLLVTENFTRMTLVVFGFVTFGMIFMGMISVLPVMVTHHAPPSTPEPKAKPEKVKTEKGLFPAKSLATR